MQLFTPFADPRDQKEGTGASADKQQRAFVLFLCTRFASLESARCNAAWIVYQDSMFLGRRHLHIAALFTPVSSTLCGLGVRGVRGKIWGGGGGGGAAGGVMHLHNRRIGYGRGGHQSYHEIYPHFGTSKSFWMRQVSGFTPCATKSPGSEVG